MLCVFAAGNISAQTSSSQEITAPTTSNTEKPQAKFEKRMERRMENKANSSTNSAQNNEGKTSEVAPTVEKHHIKAEQKLERRAENSSASSIRAPQKNEGDEGEEKIKANSSCKNILEQCKKMGFVAGGYKEGNGLWKNCFFPVISGQSVTQKGNPVTVSVNSADIASCKTSVPQERIQKTQNKMNQNSEGKESSVALPSKEDRQKRREAKAIENGAVSNEGKTLVNPQEKRHIKRMAIQGNSASTSSTSSTGTTTTTTTQQ